MVRTELGCKAADIFAGVAASAFALTEEGVVSCHPQRAISVISFRGMNEQLVRYGGGASSVVPGMPVTFLSAQGTFQKWAELDECAGQPSAQDAAGCSRYSGCKDGVDVILCTSSGGQDFPDASFAWPILRAHTR